MKIEQIELLEIRMPLVHFFETSFGRTTDRRIVLLRARVDGLDGWGEVTCGEMPFYSYETPGTAWHILRDILIPWALEKSWDSPAHLGERFRPVRGHNMAKAALENALWDIEAQSLGVPLAELLGG
ncbi:MAG TPA: o-succinylbenzoate synthase, partial [Terriglobia bacterium]|nr:o-succinylbenzoate synthase [Terriglobia bacterium]